jgi:ankyrin repeat protein
MKKSLLIFGLLSTAAYSMDSKQLSKEIKLENEIVEALGTLNFEKIKELCKQGAVDFEKKYYFVKYNDNKTFKSAYYGTPLYYALFRDNLELADLLIRHGANRKKDQRILDFYQLLFLLGRYRFVPILYENDPTFLNENLYYLLQELFFIYRSNDSDKIFAAISRVLNWNFEDAQKISKQMMSEEYRQNNAKYLDDENLFNQVKNEVEDEFELQAIKKVGMDSYLQGRELGINLHEMQEQQNFFKRNIQLLENTKEEE